MRKIDSKLIIDKLAQSLADINFTIDKGILGCFQQANVETKEKEFLNILVENAEIADAKKIALCQDTGIVVVFAKVGKDVSFDGDLRVIINEAVKKGYEENNLRKSVVADPLDRKNTGDNTPAIIHMELVDGDVFELAVMAKGGGSENVSVLEMMSPADGEQGIVDLVVNRIREKGANCCPPLILGIGVGGNFEKVAMISKKALFRELGQRNPNSRYAALEERILKEVNDLGIGVGGFGGKLTVMDVFIEASPCHIASMPVALNVGCHSTRHAVIKL